MEEVLSYIKNNWSKTIRSPQKGVPYPFTSPSIELHFKDFYYWDTYFTNIGLLLDGYHEQVKNNLDNIAYFIGVYGYMPNANIFTNRSQPPLFSRMIKDYYEFKRDKSILSKYLPALLKEYDFWMTKRIGEHGLNVYRVETSDSDLDSNYKWLADRVQVFSDNINEQRLISKNLLSIAESGLDFNMRFKTEKSRIDIHKFLQLDINCFMFDVERNISYFYHELGDENNSRIFKEKYEKRRTDINKYFLTKDNIYLDYNFVDKKFSSILSIVSMFPYVFGISNDSKGAKKVLEKLELEFGVSVCEKRDDDLFYQWDYPTMWGNFVYLTYLGLKNVGLIEDANRIKNKYIKVIDKNFIKHKKLFEKYDALTGDISNKEYESADMMGWTAATYRYLIEN